MIEDISERRRELLRELFDEGAPRLWCPPLTHYTPDGGLDHERMAAHWGFMVPHVKAFLVPGTTGDGWEMAEGEVHELTEKGYLDQ